MKRKFRKMEEGGPGPVFKTDWRRFIDPINSNSVTNYVVGRPLSTPLTPFTKSVVPSLQKRLAKTILLSDTKNPGLLHKDLSTGNRFAPEYMKNPGLKPVATEVNPVFTKTPFDWKTAIDAAMPYASNIINSFKKPPVPRMPARVSPIVLPKIDMSNERNLVERSARAADLEANYSLDENTAAAVRNANLATKIQGLNSVNQAETNANAEQAARAASANMQVDAFNTGNYNNYQDSLVARKIAMQREQSDNFANAADKYIAINNQRAQRDLDLKKWSVLRDIWKQSGVDTRMMERLKKEGIIKPEDGLDTPDVRAMGGRFQRVFGDGGKLGTMAATAGNTLMVRKIRPASKSDYSIAADRQAYVDVLSKLDPQKIKNETLRLIDFNDRMQVAAVNYAYDHGMTPNQVDSMFNANTRIQREKLRLIREYTDSMKARKVPGFKLGGKLKKVF